VAGRVLAARRGGGDRDLLQARAHRAPLLAPGVGLVLAGLEALADLVDLAEGDRAVGGHALGGRGRGCPRRSGRGRWRSGGRGGAWGLRGARLGTWDERARAPLTLP